MAVVAAVVLVTLVFALLGYFVVIYLPAFKHESGYPGPENHLYPDVESLCISTVREAYTSGEIDEDELETRMGAAIRGDYRGAGIDHLPIQLETVWM